MVICNDILCYLVKLEVHSVQCKFTFWNIVVVAIICFIILFVRFRWSVAPSHLDLESSKDVFTFTFLRPQLIGLYSILSGKTTHSFD